MGSVVGSQKPRWKNRNVRSNCARRIFLIASLEKQVFLRLSCSWGSAIIRNKSMSNEIKVFF